jgi:predicted small integral membrane protein
MRHVMALRVSKAVLVLAIALFYTILVLNNITDYGSNYEFVRHVLMMDSTFPGNHLMWRAVDSPLIHTVFYIGIIAWESVTMLLCWWAGVRLLKSWENVGTDGTFTSFSRPIRESHKKTIPAFAHTIHAFLSR